MEKPTDNSSVEKRIASNQGYNALGIVARIKQCGNVQMGMLTMPIYQYITFDTGKGNEPICARFKGYAPSVTEADGETYLDTNALKLGEIVVTPNLLYEKIPWSTKLRNEHMMGLATYKPKDIVIADAPDADEEAFDLGALNMAEDTDTKSVIDKHLNETKH